MKGISAVVPLAVTLGATAASAVAIPDSMIPHYFKRASSLPQVTTKGNGMIVSNQINGKRADILSSLLCWEQSILPPWR